MYKARCPLKVRKCVESSVALLRPAEFESILPQEHKGFTTLILLSWVQRSVSVGKAAQVTWERKNTSKMNMNKLWTFTHLDRTIEKNTFHLTNRNNVLLYCSSQLCEMFDESEHSEQWLGQKFIKFISVIKWNFLNQYTTWMRMVQLLNKYDHF